MPSTTQHNTTSPVRTDTESKAWAALHAHPGSTTAEIAQHAGIGRSTAGKILAAWSRSGSITRTPGASTGSRRLPDRFSPATTPEPAAKATRAKTETPQVKSDPKPGHSAAQPSLGTRSTTPTATTERSDAAVPSEKRLAKGELRGLVEDYLAEHPGEEFSPGQIAKALDRSAGAINNALHKLSNDGYARQTQDSPKRFTTGES
ncbi:hypothetical protein REH65_00135 [Saccharopolyspora sp. ID03-671]|uniref:hypothetical protein n=1 Tax=Saccharopolyspora sp. ID03-671 TaxID=3073066 RepID=UPI003245E54A